MTPTEYEYTVATEAAAKQAYERHIGDDNPLAAPWDELHPATQLGWRDAVLPTVDAALKAVPDRLDRIRTLIDYMKERGDKAADIRTLEALL